MIRHFMFVRQIPKTIRIFCYGLAGASSANEVYTRCSVGLPKVAAYYLLPWLQALQQGDSDAVSEAAERLWNTFKYAPVIRMFVNLIFMMPYLLEERHCLRQLLMALGSLPVHTWLFGKVPDELLHVEGALMSDKFTGLEQIQLLLYQSPRGRHGEAIRTCLQKVMAAAGSNPMVQADVLEEIVQDCKGFGEMEVVLYAALLVFEKDWEGGCL